MPHKITELDFAQIGGAICMSNAEIFFQRNEKSSYSQLFRAKGSKSLSQMIT